MRLVYELPVTARVRLKFAPEPVPLVIGDIKSEVAWTVEGPHLSGVTLTFPEQSVSTAEPIRPLPGFEEIAFRFAAYVANTILKQTGLDAIDPRAVLHRSPMLEAETEEEARLLAIRKQTVYAGATFDAVVTKAFDPFNIGDYPNHSPALALYADGMRATDPFVRFEIFYRVMDYLFPNLDQIQKTRNNLVRHLRNFPDYGGKEEGEIRDQVTSWVKLRNRSTHPVPRRDPALNRGDLRALYEMRKHEPGIERVARWLLDSPGGRVHSGMPLPRHLLGLGQTLHFVSQSRYQIGTEKDL